MEKKPVTRLIGEGISVSLVCFHFYIAIAILIPALNIKLVPSIPVRQIHLLHVMALCFLTVPMWKNGKGIVHALINGLFLLTGAAVIIYLLSVYHDLPFRAGMPTFYDTVFATLAIVVLMEMVRRKIGWPLFIVCLAFILYVKFGQYLPGTTFSHAGYPWWRIAENAGMGQHGIWGIPLGVIVSFVFIFVLFGELLLKTDNVKLFIYLACFLTRNLRTGPAVMAVVSSGFLGSISGSATGNTVTTGNFTIPLMKKIGYTPEQAAGIEVAASVGGQWMPPVMGASGFIIAGMIGVPYLKVIKVAAIPAILYFCSVWMMIFCSSGKVDLKPLDKAEYSFMADITKTEWIVNILRLGIPVFILLYLIISGYSPFIAGSNAVFAIIAVNLLIRTKNEPLKMKLGQIWGAFRNVGFTILPISTACAIAGVIVSSVTISGLALKFTALIINAAHGYLFVAILFVMIASLFLGMEVPTTGSYIIVAAISAAALVKLGLPVLLAHLVAFWYAVDSSVTPPVCITSYAGAAIAGGDPWKTGIQAWKTAKGLYIIPFLAVFTPLTPLHWDSASLLEISLAILTGFLGLFAFAAFIEGYFLTKLNFISRPLWGIASVLLLFPYLASDIIGILLLASLAYFCFQQKKAAGSVSSVAEAA